MQKKKKKERRKELCRGERRDRREAEMKCFLQHAAAAAAAVPALVFACVCMQVISGLTSAYLQDKQEGERKEGMDGGEQMKERDNEVTLQ